MWSPAPPPNRALQEAEQVADGSASRRHGSALEPSDVQLIDTWQQVRKAMNAVDSRLACSLSSADAPGPLVHEALAAVVASPGGAMTATELAGVLGLTAQGCRRLIDRLVDTGLAYRRHISTDRRAVTVLLSEAGTVHEQTSTVDYAQQLRIELSVLGAERVAQLRDICETLQNWSPPSVR